MGIIYVLTNKINGKQYVGQTTQTFNKRLQGHLYMSNKEKPRMVIGRAIKKYGIDSFGIETHDIMNCCLDDTEKVMIKTLNTKTPNGYNVIDGGNTTYGFHHTEETKKKMSLSNIGENNPMYGKIGDKNPNYGSHRTKDTKRKISKIAVNRKYSKKSKEKMSISSCKYTYEITKPSGDIEIIINMCQYCSNNNLDQSTMYKVAKGKYKYHKGYTARILNQIEKEN